MAKKPSRENKKLTELGQIGRSGRLISQYIRGIGTEKTELILNPVTGKSEVVSKGEALARKIWLKALGYVYDIDTEAYSETGELNLDYVKLLIDRVEGKIGVQSDDPNDSRTSAADRVSQANKDRLNAMAEDES